MDRGEIWETPRHPAALGNYSPYGSVIHLNHAPIPPYSMQLIYDSRHGFLLLLLLLIIIRIILILLLIFLLLLLLLFLLLLFLLRVGKRN